MLSRLIHIEHDSEESLQSQIRRKLVEGILIGAFSAGSKLPSTRVLAKQLEVSRNTVVLVYQTLLDEGYIVSRERSGIYVSEALQQGRVGKS
ncbi:GntR family transcriptional regulator [Psychrosphaera algicola]|uniref:GntR family transcriptional regulator n=2 Tax=Psychrosphaera TaxID=907197 RepID=A0ABT5FCH0_9GAMM|nr:GntR family transcriptional regulator [Psychrosphaera sp. G1-22]MDC2889223.1 GntR family transcriptional regulator [Psychrosphaera sp. G1-22]